MSNIPFIYYEKGFECFLAYPVYRWDNYYNLDEEGIKELKLICFYNKLPKTDLMGIEIIENLSSPENFKCFREVFIKYMHLSNTLKFNSMFLCYTDEKTFERLNIVKDYGDLLYMEILERKKDIHIVDKIIGKLY